MSDDFQVKAALENIPSFTVTGVSTVASNADDTATEEINALWERFFAADLGQRLPGRKSDIIYAVYSDYEGDHTAPYRVTIGYVTEDMVDEGTHDTPGGLHSINVTAGDYGVMSAAGPQPQSLLETWKAIWSSDLDRAFATDFELYGPRFFQDGLNEVLIYIGLKK